MADSIARANGNGHANADDHATDDGSMSLDLADMRAWINRALVAAGWNQEALAAHMKKDRAHVSRVLSGEKPLSAAFIRALPDDVEALVAGYYAESFGLVVVTPAAGPDAVKLLVAGLLGVIGSQMPAKATAMARMNLDVRRKVAR